MTAVASEGVAGTRHQLRQRLRSTVLGPRGGGAYPVIQPAVA
jgi:hypothetical protein